ncbi:MAG: hypothetical protein CBD01_001075 [Euryarchaeota archaeon TMED141]|nr:MAG: hypothetical protein CBD01_001075 [Euryarchaeota archaeon TMED141]DAC08575.1 MAG TPA: hypothetical protein D7I09_07570 [Candidatus Poseidoniales archaeon]HII19170.1 hypothetical protein [Candidatus Poseidoniaceae archaeon]
MVAVHLIEALAETLCGVAAVLFTFIATLSRSPAAERVAQNVISLVLVLAAGVLWWLSLAGGELWGSNYLPRPLSLFCVLIAVAARMNIKGTNVSFGANPHSIGRSDDESE